SVTFTSQITANTEFTFIIKWSNTNVTTAYNPWNVMIQLKNSSGTIVWQGKSSLDLQTLLPTTDKTTGIDNSVTITDRFKLPSTIPTGNYAVSIQILDPDHYYEPLRLAIQGR